MKIEKIQRGKAAPPSDQFERWWTEYSETRVLTREDRKSAWDAWQASRAARDAELRGLEQPDWELVSDEVREVAVLAVRHGLVIVSVPGTEDRKVEAIRKGRKPIYVQVAGWREMIDVLNDMEKRGVL